MIVRLVTGRRWVPLAVVAAGLAAHLGMWARLLPCPDMATAECVVTALAVVTGGSLAAVLARSVRLARTTARAVAALGRAPLPPAGHTAARRAGLRRVTCVPGSTPAAFTAGLLRPRVYVTEGAVRTPGDVHAGPDHVEAGAVRPLAPGELDAVLAHVRRRDPLRRVLLRAAADTLFYLPLAPRWAARQAERSELTADRAAIDRAGPSAVAGAPLSAESGRWPAAAGFDGALDARISQLAGDPVPPRRPSAKRVGVSLLGLVLMTSLMMCLGQAVVGVLTA